MASGDLDLRKSPRLIRMKMCASEQDLILMLKREVKALINRRMERLAKDGCLEEYMAGREAMLERDRKVAAVVQPPAAAKARKAASAVQPPAAGKPRKAAAEPQPPAGTGKKRKKVLKSEVPEDVIYYMILNHRKPYHDLPPEKLRKRSKRFRQVHEERVAISIKFSEYYQAIIKQFREKGYAEDYTEVSDKEEEEKDNDQENY